MASGDVDELSQYIPNLADYLVDADNIIEASDSSKLSKKFQDQGISPYFILAYGDKLTIWVFLFIIFLPSVLLMNKICKKVKLWEEIKGSFFFNSPLRAFVEQYIEITMQVVLNTQFIKFKNNDTLIATAAAFVLGVISLLLPFVAMTLIYNSRKKIQKKSWEA